MITLKNIFLIAILLTNVAIGKAQEYDADSIHYTHIDKPRKEIRKSEEPQLTKKIEYFFNVQSGMLVGCNDCGKSKDYTFSATSIHGITIGQKLRAGLGLGFDSYQNWQTLPLFAVASWDLIGNKNKNAVYLQLAYGWAHPWFIHDGIYATYGADPFSSINGGKMINPQIGYRLRYYNLKLSAAIGYKLQRITYTKPGYGYCPACDFPQSSVDDVTQDMNRVQLVMSVGWK